MCPYFQVENMIEGHNKFLTTVKNESKNRKESHEVVLLSKGSKITKGMGLFWLVGWFCPNAKINISQPSYPLWFDYWKKKLYLTLIFF